MNDSDSVRPLVVPVDSDDPMAGLDDIPRRTFAAGETIFRQGAPGNSMFVIQSGEVQILLFGDAAQALKLREIHAGDFFGELSLFDDRARSASAVALTDVVAFELRRDQFTDFLARKPRAALAIFRSMSERLRETNAMLSGQAAQNVDAELDASRGWSERLADSITRLNGSWAFIGALVMVTATWFGINSYLFISKPLDPYPYQFFNLVLGILVGLQGPLIMMSQNREGMKERARADTDYRVNLKNEMNIERVLREIRELQGEVRYLRQASAEAARRKSA